MNAGGSLAGNESSSASSRRASECSSAAAFALRRGFLALVLPLLPTAFGASFAVTSFDAAGEAALECGWHRSSRVEVAFELLAFIALESLLVALQQTSTCIDVSIEKNIDIASLYLHDAAGRQAVYSEFF